MGEVRYIYLVEKPQWTGMLGILVGKWKLKVNKT
jgi:hypothetical protein